MIREIGGNLKAEFKSSKDIQEERSEVHVKCQNKCSCRTRSYQNSLSVKIKRFLLALVRTILCDRVEVRK